MIIDFQDNDGNPWSAELASHGNTSAYLNRRVHRPIIRFVSKGKRQAPRYLGLPEGFATLSEIPTSELSDLLEKSRAH
jgi:hypothetical protein